MVKINEVGKALCEVCSMPLPNEPFEECICVERQDAIWYANGGQCELVSLVEGTRLSIERVGYTKFIYYPANYDETGDSEHLLDTADFVARGFDTDQALSEGYSQGVFEIEDSPWFEIFDVQNQMYLDTITFVTLDEAYAYVLDLPDKDRKWVFPE
jgi:hypothetical protein